MDIKQLVTGDPKTGFYPITQDTITVIELNKAVMSLTNESSSEDIIAAFDNLESFQTLIAEVRNPQNICSGILINETPEDKRVGKYEASIIANTDAETLHVRWVENDRIIALSITNTDGTMSCVRTENNVGGGSGNIYIIDGNKINNNTFNIDDFNKLKTAIRNNNIVFINITEDPSYINIIGTQILSYGENLIQLYVIDYSKADGEKLAEYIIFNIAIESDTIKITKIQSNLENKFLTKDDVLTKYNTAPFTPTEDYNPATKKYVDDRDNIIVNNILPEINDCIPTENIILFVTPNDIISNSKIETQYNGNLSEYILWESSSNDSFFINTLSNDNNKLVIQFSYRNIKITEKYYIIKGTFKKHITSKKIIEKYVQLIIIINNQRVLTESEYIALGEAVNTDDILYFVTPDA